MDGVAKIRQTDDIHTQWTVKIGGLTREIDAEITEQIPDERVAWTSTAGTGHAGVVTFHRCNSPPSPKVSQKKQARRSGR